jgi:hypothetical protein
LDENKLNKLDYLPLALLRNNYIIRNTWQLDDVTVLIVAKWGRQIHTVEITIYERPRDNYSMAPLWVSSSM